MLTIDHSTSELPFYMDSDVESFNPPRNNLVQSFRATPEPPTNYNPSPNGRNYPKHINQLSEQGMQFSLRRQTPPSLDPDLESSTQHLKNLLSIKSTPSHSASATPPFPPMDGPPSPSPIHHNR